MNKQEIIDLINESFETHTGTNEAIDDAAFYIEKKFLDKLDIKQVINTNDELELLIEALNRFEKFCKNIEERPIQGYGNVNEFAKKEKWGDKARAINELTIKISNQFH